MKYHYLLTLALLTVSVFSGCRHEPDPYETAFGVNMQMLNGRDLDKVQTVHSRYQIGNIQQPGEGAVIPLMVTQDQVAAHPKSVRNIMTPQGVKQYNLRRFIDGSNPRVFHRYSNVAVLEEDAFWRADGDDAPIIEGEMPSTSIGNLARSTVPLKQEVINMIGEQNRQARDVNENAERLLAKANDLAEVIRKREDAARQQLQAYEKLAMQTKADRDEISRLKNEIAQLESLISDTEKSLRKKVRGANNRIDGQ